MNTIDVFYIAFQLTVSAESLGQETCIPVNGAPERCGVFLSQERFGEGGKGVWTACKSKAEREHDFWKSMILGDQQLRASGAIAWVQCKRSTETVSPARANARTTKIKQIVGGE